MKTDFNFLPLYGVKTWVKTGQWGNPAYYNTNECQVAELTDHSLMLNMRERGE